MMRTISAAALTLAAFGSAQAQQPPAAANGLPQTVTLTVTLEEADLIVKGLSCPGADLQQKLQMEAVQQIAQARAAAMVKPPPAPKPQH